VTDESVRDEVIAFLELLLFAPSTLSLKTIQTEQFLESLYVLWFDEVYPLSLRYHDCLKGDRNSHEIEKFSKSFSDIELEALSRFHHFLHLRTEVWKKETTHLDEKIIQNILSGIRKDAELALYSFSPDSEQTGQRRQCLLRRLQGRQGVNSLFGLEASQSHVE